jgi:hypothetical protein
MTRDEAKELLSMFRPGTADETDPIFTEALALAREDQELREWFESSVAFDREFRNELSGITAPAAVREEIFASRKIIRPQVWWHRRLSAREFAAAAAVIFAVSVGVLWFGQRPVSFVEFRREIADHAWGPTPHVDFRGLNLQEVREYLANENVATNFTVPPALAEGEVFGCSVIHWHGRKVPMLCFNSERQHVHLVVVERNLFEDAPTQTPQTDQWASWRTASWSKDEYSYVLTGLKTHAFIKKFRKAKRWDWEG